MVKRWNESPMGRVSKLEGQSSCIQIKSPIKDDIPLALMQCPIAWGTRLGCYLTLLFLQNANQRKRCGNIPLASKQNIANYKCYQLITSTQGKVTVWLMIICNPANMQALTWYSPLLPHRNGCRKLLTGKWVHAENEYVKDKKQPGRGGGGAREGNQCL